MRRREKQKTGSLTQVIGVQGHRGQLLVEQLGSRLAKPACDLCSSVQTSLRKAQSAHLHKFICSIWLQQVLDCMERSAQQQELPAPHLKGRLLNTSLPQNNLQTRQKRAAWQAGDRDV